MKTPFAIIFLVLLLAVFSPGLETVHADGSQKICAKDVNGDGNIDFTSEVANCVTVQGSDFCPLGAVNCGLGVMDPLCPTNGTNCPGGTYNPTLNRCERPQIVTGYECPTTGTTYGDQTSCQNACMQTASCQTGTYSVSVSPDQSSSYWFYNGAYRMFCSGNGLYLSANPGGSSRSWTLSGASCSGDANGGENAFITYLQGSGNQLYVYGCDGMQDPEYGSWTPVNCGRLFGVLTFDHAVVSGSTRSTSCILDDASYLSFHDRCDWATWTGIGISGASYQNCPLGNYPCSGGTCSTGSACAAVNGCPAGYQLVSGICIAQPQGGVAVTVDSSTHLCEAPVTNSCTGDGFSFDPIGDSCVKNPDCGEGMLEGGLDLCIFNIGSDRCPAGFEYNAAFSACTRDAACPSGGILNRLRDVCETANVPSCPEGTAMDPGSGNCLADPSCQVGNFDADLGKCVLSAASLARAGYIFNPGLDRFERPPSCPDGSSYSDAADLCTAPAGHACPSPGVYNASSGKCEATGVPVCPAAGMTYDDAAGACYAPAACPGAGATLNAVTDLCEAAFTPACAGGYSWNPARLLCEMDPSCSPGTYNPARDRCESAPSGTSCPASYSWNGSAGKCQALPSCSAGAYNPVTDRCEQSATASYACSLGGSYPSLAACSSSCAQSAACSTVTPNVTLSGPQAWCQPSRIVCSGGTLTFYCSQGGSLSYNVTGMNCSSDVSLPGGYYISYLVGSGQGFTIYGCQNVYDPEFGYYPNGICDFTGYVSTQGVNVTGSTYPGTPGYWNALDALGVNTFPGYPNALWGHDSTIWTPWYPLYFNGIPYQVCPLGNYACGGGYCSAPGACSGPTYSCPVGWTLSGSTCYQAAGCPAGGSLNGISEKCEAAGTPTCSSGTYDPANGVCYQAVTCPNGGNLNGSVDKCQIVPSNSCQTGYTLDSGRSLCTALPQCAAGSYHSSRDRCEQAPATDCAADYTWSGGRGLCESNPTHDCPLDGFSYNPAIDLCSKEVLCPGGGYLSGEADLCVVQMYSGMCPAGFVYNPSTDSCLRDPSCPAGVLDSATRKCVAPPADGCASGYAYNSGTGMCQMPPVCETGTYDGRIDKCAVPGSTLCPTQYTFNSLELRCERFPSCSDGAAYFASMDLCIKDPVRQCPTPDYTYQASSRQCVAPPVCYVGNFDPATNTCAGSSTGCPLGSQYACLPNPATGILQCSDNACFNPSTMPTQTTGADTSSYHNDGTVDPSTGDCQGALYIFNGNGKECRTAGISTTFFNCCNTDPGSFLFIQNTCGSGDAETVQAVGKGMCHYIGDYCQQKWPLIGCVQRANTYCCFNSKLGRIIHEQGRIQLQQFGAGGDWGGAESPNCRGFTPEEFQMLDFSRIDLSEYFGDIKTKAASEVQQDMQRQVSDFYDKVQRK